MRRDDLLGPVRLRRATDPVERLPRQPAHGADVPPARAWPRGSQGRRVDTGERVVLTLWLSPDPRHRLVLRGMQLRRYPGVPTSARVTCQTRSTSGTVRRPSGRTPSVSPDISRSCSPSLTTSSTRTCASSAQNGFGIAELGGVAKHSMERYFGFVTWPRPDAGHHAPPPRSGAGPRRWWP